MNTGLVKQSDGWIGFVCSVAFVLHGLGRTISDSDWNTQPFDNSTSLNGSKDV